MTYDTIQHPVINLYAFIIQTMAKKVGIQPMYMKRTFREQYHQLIKNGIFKKKAIGEALGISVETLINYEHKYEILLSNKMKGMEPETKQDIQFYNFYRKALSLQSDITTGLYEVLLEKANKGDGAALRYLIDKYEVGIQGGDRNLNPLGNLRKKLPAIYSKLKNG